jgi:hypothetical protein
MSVSTSENTKEKTDKVTKSIKSKLDDIGVKEKESKNDAFDEVRHMRKTWSFCLLIMVGLIVGFDMVFIILVGTGHLIYNNNYIIGLVLVEGIGKIFVLAYLVVNYLFRDQNK